MNNYSTKSILVTCLYLLASVMLCAQVPFHEQNVSLYIYNRPVQYDVEINSSIPQFDDTSAFFKALNDSISYKLSSKYDTTGRLDGYSAELYQQAIEENEDTSWFSQMGTPEDEQYSYTIFLNRSGLLSFSITHSSHAGGGGYGSGSLTKYFMIDSEKKTFLTFEDFFDSVNALKVIALFDSRYDAIHEHSGFGLPSDTADGYIVYYTGDIILTDTSMIAVYSHTWYHGEMLNENDTDLPYSVLTRYMTKRGKALVKKLNIAKR